MNFNTIKTFGHAAKFVLQKNSPVILMAGGIASCTAGTVLACKATTKAAQIIEEKNKSLEEIEEVSRTAGKDLYSEDDAKKDMVIVYTHTAVKFLKLYGPAITLELLGFAMMIGSHRIMAKRNAALAVAFTGLHKTFKKYRDRVIEEFGKDKDYQFLTGQKEEKRDVEYTDKKGKKKKKKEKILTDPDVPFSPYSKFFDSSSIHWTKDAEQNYMFVRSQMQMANCMLQARGHMFLNEVYDLLGIERTQSGAVLGWYGRDKIIDFDIQKKNGSRNDDFISGYEPVILLDFNIDPEPLWERLTLVN